MTGSQSNSRVELVDMTAFEHRLSHGMGPLLLACLHEEQMEVGQRKVLLDIASQRSELEVVRAAQGSLDAFISRFELMGTPTYLLFSGGLERQRMLGMADSMSMSNFVAYSLEQGI